ncbi:hypothetical protein OEZ86_003144 [Tetradesmus obliquus]|nr:hypothetical protein OEZ86_003144 [Tetradesmus obliquus]
MKNLTLQSVSVVDLDLGPAAADDGPVSHFCLDSTEGLLYAVTRSALVLCLPQGGKKLLWSTPLFEEPPPLFSPDGSSSSSSTPAELVVSFSFVLELDAVFIACSSGELLLLHTASRSVEEVGVVSGGVAAAGWSPDGELLVLLGYNQGLLMMNKEWDVLAELWHRSNWHWYLKHEQLTSLPHAAGCLSVAWDEALPGRLHVVAGSGSYSVMDVGWDVAVSARGTAAVIDGHTLLITPLRHGQVPPPMAAVRAVLPRPANAVAWLDGDVAADLDASADTIAAAAAAAAAGQGGHGALYWGAKLLANDVTSFVLRGGGPGGPALLYVTRQALLFVVMVGQLPSYVHSLPDESTAAVTYRPSEYPGDLRAAMAMAMRPGGAAAAARDPHVRAVEPGAMLLAAPWGDVGVVLQMQRGNLEGVSPRLLVLAAICDALEQQQHSKAWQLAVTHRVDFNLLVDYAWPRVVQNAAQFVAAVRDSSDLCDLLFALQPGSVLQQGAVYGDLHQMLGWQQQQQQQQPAAAAAGLASLAASQAADTDSAAAAVDASNKVSAVCAAVRQAVLQLPGRYLQGHLKTVAISYAKSDPPSLEAALIAIREVKEASVSSSTTAAAAAAPAAADSAAAAVAAAVAVTPQEAACPAQLSTAADAALKHLLLYVDVDQLYRTALGLYDLSLAFMVVGHSQKDPGEYLSELTAFGSQSDVSLRCHAIDLSLGRYDKALAHLVAAGPAHFDAALKLAKERGLLRQLLALTQQQQQQQQGEAAAGGSAQQQQQQQQQRLLAVLAAYGDSLLDGRKAEDAAVAYSAAGLTEHALGAYKAANAWRMVMVLSARLQHSQQQQQALARELAEQLQASGSGADAAQLLVQYLEDVDGAVAALVAAKEWREALRVAYAGGRQDLVDTTVVPGAAQASAVLLEEATESTERIAKYTARLKEVRNRRIAMEAALAAAEAEAAGAAGAADNDDLASDAGVSLISGLTAARSLAGAAAAVPSVAAALKSTPQLSTLLAAVTAAGISIPDSNKWTILAPTNEAFEARLKKDLNTTAAALLSNKELLTKVLQYHVIPAGAVMSSQLKDNQTFTTALAGAAPLTVRVKSKEGKTYVKFIGATNWAKVVTADIKAGNSVVHIVKDVLLPAGVGIAGDAEGWEAKCKANPTSEKCKKWAEKKAAKKTEKAAAAAGMKSAAAAAGMKSAAAAASMKSAAAAASMKSGTDCTKGAAAAAKKP